MEKRLHLHKIVHGFLAAGTRRNVRALLFGQKRNQTFDTDSIFKFCGRVLKTVAESLTFVVLFQHVPHPSLLTAGSSEFQLSRALAWLTTRRRARKSLTFTVFAFKSKTSAISSIENPSTSFKISIRRSLS